MANDRYAHTVRGRLWFVLLAAPLCVAALLAIATDLGPVVIIVGAAAYFVGHFAYLTPYEALYPDLVPDSASGRSRSIASSWRFAGLGLALIGGGFLLDWWTPACEHRGGSVRAGSTVEPPADPVRGLAPGHRPGGRRAAARARRGTAGVGRATVRELAADGYDVAAEVGTGAGTDGASDKNPFSGTSIHPREAEVGEPYDLTRDKYVLSSTSLRPCDV